MNTTRANVKVSLPALRGWHVAVSGRDVKHELRLAIIATQEARETLTLFARIGMNDTSKLKAYTERLNKREQAEHRIRDDFLRQNQAALSGR